MEVNRSNIMTTNEQIFDEIRETGVITEKQISLLKRRSNAGQKNVFSGLDIFEGSIKLTHEQGEKALTWLKRFIKKGVYGCRELEILETAKPEDFEFTGFYDAGNAWLHYYVPTYGLGNGKYYMQYVPLAEPYIVG